MANVYISLNQGQADMGPDEVTESSSSTSGADVELRIAVPGAGGANLYRSEIIDIVERLLEYIADGRTATLADPVT
jgi:hypothetical protein